MDAQEISSQFDLLSQLSNQIFHVGRHYDPCLQSSSSYQMLSGFVASTSYF